MICGKCGKRVEAAGQGVCPACGARVSRQASGVVRTSTVLISAGQTDAVYRSVKDVPAVLRSKLLRSTNGLNSATILIADRRGRQEIAKALRRLPPGVRKWLAPSILGEASPAPADDPRARQYRILSWVLVALSLVLVWLVFR